MCNMRWNGCRDSFDSMMTWLGSYGTQAPSVSALSVQEQAVKRRNSIIIVTDPPYYDAIPYSDAMDFFYVWLRTLYPRVVSDDMRRCSLSGLGPKWNHDAGDGRD